MARPIRINNDKFKTCKICKVFTPIEGFYNVTHGRWRSSYCKKCDNERARLRNIRNYDPVRARIKYDKLQAKGLIAAKERRRRAAKLMAGGSHTLSEWENMKAVYSYTCPSCFKKEPEITLQADHIMAIARGGSDGIENIQPLCGPCNRRKHTKTIKFPLLQGTGKKSLESD